MSDMDSIRLHAYAAELEKELQRVRESRDRWRSRYDVCAASRDLAMSERDEAREELAKEQTGRLMAQDAASEYWEAWQDGQDRQTRALKKLREVWEAMCEIRHGLPPEHPLRMKLLVPETMVQMARMDLGAEVE